MRSLLSLTFIVTLAISLNASDLSSVKSTQTDEQWDVLEYWPSIFGDLPGGVAFDGEFIWASYRVTDMVYFFIFDPFTGQIIDSFPQNATSAWGVRDMCFDGTYIYGGWEQGLDKYDAETRQYIETIPYPANMLYPRANAYDPTSDHFYCGNFASSLYEMDRNGNLIRTFQCPDSIAVYGLAWIDDDPLGPYILVCDGANSLYWKLDPVAGVVMGVVYDPEPIPPNTTADIYGGIDYAEYWDPAFNVTTLLGLYLGDVNSGMVFYEMIDLSPLTVDVVAVPLNPPILIPAGGGYFEFEITVWNYGSETCNFNVWTMCVLPGGGEVGPLLGPFQITLDSGDTLSAQAQQFVPARAVGGVYEYHVCIGDYPNIAESSAFPFSKSAYSEGKDNVLAWNCLLSGEEDEQTVPAHQPQTIQLYSPSPNPFNPVTTINFTISRPGQIQLSVYDIRGRLVGKLMEGYYPAGTYETDFKAELLPSGIYFARLQQGNQFKVEKLQLLK